MKLLSLIGILLIFLTACTSTSKKNDSPKKIKILLSKLYPIEGGGIINLQEKRISPNKFSVTGVSTKTGEKFKGQLLNIDNSIYRTKTVSDGFLYKRTMRVRVISDVKSTGIIVGDKGTTINLNIKVQGANSAGIGIGNKGNTYKYMCCESKYITP